MGKPRGKDASDKYNRRFRIRGAGFLRSSSSAPRESIGARIVVNVPVVPWGRLEVCLLLGPRQEVTKWSSDLAGLSALPGGITGG